MSDIPPVVQSYLMLKPTTKVIGDYSAFFNYEAISSASTYSKQITTIYIRSVSANTYHAQIDDNNIIFIDDCAIENVLNYYDYFKMSSKDDFITSNAFSRAIDCKRYSRIFLENGFIFQSYISMAFGTGIFPGLKYDSSDSGLTPQESSIKSRNVFKGNFLLYCHFHEECHILLREGLVVRDELRQKFSQLIKDVPGVKIDAEEARQVFSTMAADLIGQEYHDQFKQFIETEEFSSYYTTNPLLFLDNEESLDEFCSDLYACEQVFRQIDQNKDNIELIVSNILISTFLNIFNRSITIDTDWLLPLLYSLQVGDLITEELINKYSSHYSVSDDKRYKFVYELHLRTQFVQIKILEMIDLKFGKDSLLYINIHELLNAEVITYSKALWNLNGPISSWNNSLLEQILLATVTFQDCVQSGKMVVQEEIYQKKALNYEEVKKILKEELLLKHGFKD